MRSNYVSEKDTDSTKMWEPARVIKLLSYQNISQQMARIIQIPPRVILIHKKVKQIIVKIIKVMLSKHQALNFESVKERFTQYIFELTKLQIQGPFRKKLFEFIESQPRGWREFELKKGYVTDRTENSTLQDYLNWKEIEENKLKQSTLRKSSQTIHWIENAIHQKQYCLKCNPNLIQNNKIINTDQKYSWLFGNHDDRYLQQLVKLKACALLNSRGGYLLIEVNDQPIDSKCDQVKRIIRRFIFPSPFSCQVEPVSEELPKKNYKGFIRVKLVPRDTHLAYYVVKKWDDPQQSKPRAALDKFVLLNQNKGCLDDFVELSNPQEVYTFLLKSFSFYKKNKSSYPIKQTPQINRECINPYHRTIFQSEYDLGKESQFMKIKSQQPQPFENNYFLILTNLDMLKENLDRYFSKRNFKYQLMKPYSFYDNNYFKSIWFLGITQIEEAAMRDIIKYVADMRRNGGNNSKYHIMRCTKQLTINHVCEQQDYPFIEDYMTIFSKKFNKKVNLTKKNKKTQKGSIYYDYTFSFQTMQESIFFSYLLLENYERKFKFNEDTRE